MIEITTTIDGHDVGPGADEAIQHIKNIEATVNACLERYFPNEKFDTTEFQEAVRTHFHEQGIEIQCKFKFDNYDLSSLQMFSNRWRREGVIPFILSYRRDRGVTLTYYNLFGLNDEDILCNANRLIISDKNYLAADDNLIFDLRTRMIKFNDSDVNYDTIRNNFKDGVIDPMMGIFYRLKWASKFNDELAKTEKQIMEATQKFHELAEAVETAKKTRDEYVTTKAKKIAQRIRLLMEKCKDA